MTVEPGFFERLGILVDVASDEPAEPSYFTTAAPLSDTLTAERLQAMYDELNAPRPHVHIVHPAQPDGPCLDCGASRPR